MFLAVATTSFGVEAVLKRELQSLGYEIVRSDNGRVYFHVNTQGVIEANMHLRTAERVFIVLGSQKVLTYDNLFDWVKQLSIAPLVSKEGQFVINAKSVKSVLYSLRDIQSIVKKSMVENLKASFKTDTLSETKARYDFLLNLQQNQAELWLDTSGQGLHKRGYRTQQGEAPIKETLAAALVLLSFYDESRILYDPFCGSGTIVIEAAMIALNIAPGLQRSFAFETHQWANLEEFKTVKKQAYQNIRHDLESKIYASDRDPKMVAMAEENAISAGVDSMISFEVAQFNHKVFDQPYGIIITNPPYGERLEEKETIHLLYEDIGKMMLTKQDYSYYVITSTPQIEKIVKRQADRTRVLYNGNIKSRYYQFYGPKPRQ